MPWYKDRTCCGFNVYDHSYIWAIETLSHGPNRNVSSWVARLYWFHVPAKMSSQGIRIRWYIWKKVYGLGASNVKFIVD